MVQRTTKCSLSGKRPSGRSDETHQVNRDRPAKVYPAMGLFKSDLYRMFAIGFAVGTLFVFSTIETGVGERIANGVVPVVEAQSAQ